FDLSGGEKQRLLVSIASLSKTNLFLFDEPTSGLDYINMERIASSSYLPKFLLVVPMDVLID
ncbi:ATP-binding cassette domain-containing protein, partial [Enterococcus faecium]|uniref:ATP-binding cassette domain-containing protein n=1 Tax=Enterococcus faecium TaxID=1352 RepID=UPI00293189A8